MTRGLLFVICAALLIAGCKRAPENKDAVKQAVVEHLKKNAALEVSQLDIEVADVQFSGNEANAKVSIKPKSAPDQGMTMPYTLDRKGDRWEVRPRSTSGHGAMGGMGGGAGSAPVSPEASGAAGEMPSGHPPVNSPGGAASKGGDLPPGHPPVNQAPQKK